MFKEFLCLIGFLAIFNGEGMKVVPFIHSFSPYQTAKSNDDNNKNKSSEIINYNLTNKSDSPMALGVTVYRRRIDDNGKEELQKDNNSFLVFPTQIIINPHESQIVKVRWRGNPDFNKNPNLEQAFRVEFKQYNIDLDVKKKQNQKSLRFCWCILTSLYMTPDGSKEDPKITLIKQSGNNYIVTVENFGTKRVYANALKLPIKIKNTKHYLNEFLSKYDLTAVIFPGAKRQFIIRK